MTNKTIDHISNAEVSISDGNNELFTMSALAAGLKSIDFTVRQVEEPIRIKLGDDLDSSMFFGFGMPGVSRSFEELLPCLFHWYGVSVCNYARLVGFLTGISCGAYTRNSVENPDEYKKIKVFCDNYVASIPELTAVSHWRNKVFAHFALTDPRSKDNGAMLDVSTMSPTMFSNGRFQLGGMQVMCRGGTVEMPAWSITETHEKLSSRFWPVTS